MGKPRMKIDEYIEDKLLRFCETCSAEGKDIHRLTRTRKLAKTMANYIKTKWKIKE
ncbi:MAG: hypothetical protein GTN40_02630 [Candidatus Aenigmarchaeota archaeon]|nr:hypothetical protein [Candidatus Aenigmarchaeota archaeon]